MIKGILFDMGGTLVRIEYSPIKKGEVIYIPLPGIPALLDGISPHFKLAIVSNTLTWRREDLQVRLRPTGILHYFDYIVTSVDVEAEKPLPLIFEDALTHLGLNANEVVMVGDRLDTDILGAKRMGIKSILLDWQKQLTASDPDDIVPDLVVSSAEELQGALLTLIGMKASR